MNSNANIMYYLTRSLFLGFGISLLFYNSGKDCYLGAILGLLFGIMITYGYYYILLNKKEPLSKLYAKSPLIGFIARFLLILSSYIILLYCLILYSTFTISFLLTNTPAIYILIPFLLLAFYCAFKGLKIISRLASTLLPISLIFCLFAFFGLSVFFESTNFLPFLTINFSGFFKTALTFAGISAFPNILTLHFTNPPKNYFKIYILASLTIIFALICINGVFGAYLTSIFRFPEYMVLKQLKIFRFIEKVENIFSVIWIIDLYITSTMAIYSLKESLPAKHNKLSMTLILIATMLIIDNFFGFNYTNELASYYILPFISLILSIIIMIPFMYLIKRHSK